MKFLGLSQQDWLFGIFLFSAVVVFGNGIHWVLFRLLHRKQTDAQRQSLGLRQYLAKPSRAVLLSIGLLIVMPLVPGFPPLYRGRIEQVVECLLVLFLEWWAIGAVYVFQAVTLNRFDTSVADNLRARRVHTQMQVFRRILIGFVVVRSEERRGGK